MKRLACIVLILFLLSGCQADTSDAGLLAGLIKQEQSEPQCISLDFSIAGTGENNDYIDASASLWTERCKNILCMRDIDLRLDNNGALYELDLEIWSDGETAYCYIGNDSIGNWYEHPASETRAGGIDPVTVSDLLLDLCDAGRMSEINRTEDGGLIILEFDLSGEFLSDLLNRTDTDLADGTVTWSGGTCRLIFDQGSGAWQSGSVTGTGMSDGMTFEYALDFEYLGVLKSFEIPQDVIDAGKNQIQVAAPDE